MIKINTIDDLNKYASKLPRVVIMDIDKRITDWLAAGGNKEDPYINQQFKYAENVLNNI
ncbi:DUF6877 family protein [Clostridium ihumii]|uniref:DUF6877 family protein n=1 Tax=Clostridium ihumii TaxID=1470356 RepID=UPI000B1ADFB9